MPAKSHSLRARTKRQVMADLYAQVREEEQAKRAHANEVRETAWHLYWSNRPYTWKWWRIGFQTQFGKRAGESDYTVIPRHDTLAQEMGSRFPEFAGDDGTARLWDFLLSPYVPMPSRAEMMAEAERRFEDYDQAADEQFVSQFCETEY